MSDIIIYINYSYTYHDKIIKLCNFINLFSSYKSYILSETTISDLNETTKYNILNNNIIKNDNTHFIIYTDDISKNPLHFKNVVRWIIDFPCSDTYNSFDSRDIILFADENIFKNIILQNKINYFYPDIIDYYNDDINDKSIILNIENNVENNIESLIDNILRKTNFDNIRFTEPLICLFNKNGLTNNEIDVNISLKTFSIHIQFILNSYDFQYQNLFDLNYGGFNIGPRIEINNTGIISLILGDSFQNFKGYIFNKKIELNTHYNLKLSFYNNQIHYNINNTISFFNISKTNFDISKIYVAGGFNEDRVYKNGTLYTFKLYNYYIPIIKELNAYLNNFDNFFYDYPRRNFNFFAKYQNMNIKFYNSYDNITLRFLLKIKNEKVYKIIDLNNLIIFKENNIIKMKINTNIYVVFYVPNIDRHYNIILSISLNNNEAVVCINNKINILKLNNENTINVTNIIINDFLQNLSISNYNMNNFLKFNTIDLNKYINYYNTFGFMKISNLFISLNENMIKAFCYNTLINSKNITDYIPRSMEYLTFFLNIIKN